MVATQKKKSPWKLEKISPNLTKRAYFSDGWGTAHQPGTMDFDQISGCLFSTTYPPATTCAHAAEEKEFKHVKSSKKRCMPLGPGQEEKKHTGIMTQLVYSSENRDCTI